MNAQSQNLEAAIVAAGANVAPRITPAEVEANIASEYYFTAEDGFVGSTDGSLERRYDSCLELLTFCVLVLKNGFTVTGESACASPENFNAQIGRRIARENAINKVWAFMGYELKTKLANKG